MRIPFCAALATTSLALGLTVAPVSQAATTSQYIVVQGGSCQLSIPTTDTAFRPKATGARNESTSVSNFVICPFTVAPAPSSASAVTSVGMFMQSLDGVSRSVTCTAVVGAINNTPPVYSSKTVSTPATTSSNASVTWSATDFGGTSGSVITGSAWLTVTCNVPPQTGISYLYAQYNYEIGS